MQKQVNLPMTGGKFVKVGGKNNFRETGEIETGKIGGKKGHQKFWRMCQEIFREKVKL